MSPPKPTNSSSKVPLEQTATTTETPTLTEKEVMTVHSVSNSPGSPTLASVTANLIDFSTSFYPSLPDISLDDIDQCFSSSEPSLERNMNLPLQALSAFLPAFQAPLLPQASYYTPPLLLGLPISTPLPMPAALPLPPPSLVFPSSKRASASAGSAELTPTSLLPPPLKRASISAASAGLTLPSLLPSASAASPALASSSFVQVLPALQLPPIPGNQRGETYTDFICGMDLNTNHLRQTNSTEWKRLLAAIETNPGRLLTLLQTQGWIQGERWQDVSIELFCHRILTLAYIIYLNRVEPLTLYNALQIIFKDESPHPIVNHQANIIKWSRDNMDNSIARHIAIVNANGGR